MFLTVGRLDALHNLAGLSHRAKSANQRLRILDRETERFKELSFTTVIWMRRVHKVAGDLVVLDDGEMSVPKVHVVSSVSHGA